MYKTPLFVHNGNKKYTLKIVISSKFRVYFPYFRVLLSTRGVVIRFSSSAPISSGLSRKSL